MKRIHSKWWKRVIYAVLILSLLSVSLLLSIDLHVKQSVEARILTAEEAAKLDDVDCILVLGCSVKDGSPSPMLADRLKQGTHLYALHASNKLLMSGDHGRDDYDEVNVMKNYAITIGIPRDDVFMDHAGFSTYESMYRARDIFCAKKVIIVTQGYHLYRSLYVARALGLDAYGVAAEATPYAGQAYRDLRELLARNKDFVYTLFTPRPSYLGDAIPVSGDGNLTNDQ